MKMIHIDNWFLLLMSCVDKAIGSITATHLRPVYQFLPRRDGDRGEGRERKKINKFLFTDIGYVGL